MRCQNWQLRKKFTGFDFEYKDSTLHLWFGSYFRNRYW